MKKNAGKDTHWDIDFPPLGGIITRPQEWDLPAWIAIP